MSDLELYIKLTSLPENLKKEVGDFAEFLKSKLKTEKKAAPRKRKPGTLWQRVFVPLPGHLAGSSFGMQ